jgi:putative transposase
MSPDRFAVPHYPHHVRERGVRKEPTFHDDCDYLVYVRLLKKGCAKYRVEIWAYCLMTNHVHLVAVPDNEKGISKSLHDAHSEYSTYFNAKYGFSGHLWEKRPDMCVMDYEHMSNAVCYVERNPVRAGMVARAEDYLWSSAAAHCGLRDDILLSGHCPLVDSIGNWREWLRIDATEEEERTIREHTSKGRAWCTPEMLQQLEKITGRKLSPRKLGRPKRNPGDNNNPGLTGGLLF